ncbi:MAG: hypothetical protein GF364_18440 [Candidatus Lokiarchaeota archaeon]|nr:hypothetical protein [Candidatus Lokiarchaeota archaeon]
MSGLTDIIIISFFAFGLLGLSFTLRNMRDRLIDSIYLSINAINSGFFALLALGAIILRLMSEIELSVLFQKIVPFPFLIICLSGYLYHQGFLRKNPRLSTMVPMIIGFTLNVLWDLSVLLNILSYDPEITLALVYVFLGIYGSISHFLMFRVYKKILSYYDVLQIRADRLSTILVGASSFTITLAFSFELLGIYESWSIQQLIILFVAMIFMGVGIGILVVNKKRFGEMMYYIPIPIHRILIYNSGGVLVYSESVSLKTEKFDFNQDDVIISGALSAFSSFFKEILGTNELLEYIKTTQYHLTFSSLPNKSGTLVILSSGINSFIQRSLKKFSKNITPDLQQKMSNSDAFNSLKPVLDNIIITSFPYIEIKGKTKK